MPEKMGWFRWIRCTAGVLVLCELLGACGASCPTGTRREGEFCKQIMDAGRSDAEPADADTGRSSAAGQLGTMTSGAQATPSSDQHPPGSAGQGVSTGTPGAPAGTGSGGDGSARAVSAATGTAGGPFPGGDSGTAGSSSLPIQSAAGTAGSLKGPCTPKLETCDGADNDCDGRVDEEVAPEPCGLTVGICKPGMRTCMAGAWSPSCIGETPPATEICDQAAQDEDCDGSSNEGCGCNEGETQSCGSDEGECRAGTLQCSNGQWPTDCTNDIEPSPETCDDKDNDCDGRVDQPNPCTGKANKCVAGRCVECSSSLECVGGTECVAAVCDSAGMCGTQIKTGDCNLGSGTCNNQGVCEAKCPNGRVDPGEECDPDAPEWEASGGVCNQRCKITSAIYRACQPGQDCWAGSNTWFCSAVGACSRGCFTDAECRVEGLRGVCLDNFCFVACNACQNSLTCQYYAPKGQMTNAMCGWVSSDPSIIGVESAWCPTAPAPDYDWTQCRMP